MNRRRITDVFQIESPMTLWSEVIELFPLISSNLQTESIRRVFHSVNDLYQGNFPGFRACNTGYHDFNHAAAAFLAMTRLIHGAVLDNRIFSESDVLAALTAAILHDVGYIQEADDRLGTGAKHKTTHEQRSMEFLSRHGRDFGLTAGEIAAGRSIILCTDMQQDIASIPFASPQISFLGKLLAAADLLAQLSDQLYLEKLLYLFHECREAGTGDYATEADIIIRALPFYDVFENRLKLLAISTDRYLKLHFSSRSIHDGNLYRTAINKQKIYLETFLKHKGTNPCNYLRRGGIVETVRSRYGN